MHCEGCLAELSVDVSLGAPSPAIFGAVPADDVRNLPIELSAFGFRKELRLAYLAGRSRGMSTSLDQMPWRSGSPHGVFGPGRVFTATVGAWSVAAELRPVTAYITSDRTAMVVAIPACRNNRSVLPLDMSCGASPPGCGEAPHLTTDQTS